MNFFPLERHADLSPAFLEPPVDYLAAAHTLAGRQAGSGAGDLMECPRVRDLIKKGDVDILKEAMEQGVQEGCQTFDQALFMLYKEGKISLDQALINADSANNLRLKIKLAGLKGDEETDQLQQPVNGNGREDPKLDAAKSNAAFRLRRATKPVVSASQEISGDSLPSGAYSVVAGSQNVRATATLKRPHDSTQGVRSALRAIGQALEVLEFGSTFTMEFTGRDFLVRGSAVHVSGAGRSSSDTGKGR